MRKDEYIGLYIILENILKDKDEVKTETDKKFIEEIEKLKTLMDKLE